MSNEKKNPEMQLMDSVHLTAEICCSKCDKEDSSDCNDDLEAMQGFYEEGWRATERNTYCPKCAKKYLKAKKKI